MMRSTVVASLSMVAARRAAVTQHPTERETAQPDGTDDSLVEFPDCKTIPTFPGKCPIQEHPGACFRTDGKMWSCWSEWQIQSGQDCQMMTLNDEIVGFEGACFYNGAWDHDGDGEVTKGPAKMTEEEVPDCFDVDKCLAECHPITDKWGACYLDDDSGVDRAERCMCAMIPAAGAGTESIDVLLKGACTTMQVGYQDLSYDKLCTFPAEGPQPVYKCDTIPTYNKRNSAVACNPGAGSDFACFSLTRRVAWQCGSSLEKNPSCRTTTLVPEGEEFFDGACVMAESTDYANALEYEEP